MKRLLYYALFLLFLLVLYVVGTTVAVVWTFLDALGGSA